MKKSMLLLSLCLVGNLAHPGIASKAAKTLYWGMLFTPAITLEACKIATAKDMEFAKNHLISEKKLQSFALDTRPWGDVTYGVNPALLPWKKDLYDALETKEKTIIQNAHMQKLAAILTASPIAAHIVTSPLARIQHPIAKICRAAGAVGLSLSAMPWLSKKLIKEADLSIQNPRQLGAYIDHLEQTGESQERIDYLKKNLREIRAQQRG